ncbi:hypothetical protein PIROE2DRAFT_16581, partial [Piromyces sp. E2]
MKRSVNSLIKMIVFFVLSFILIYYYKQENEDTKLVSKFQQQYQDTLNNYQQKFSLISDDDRITCEEYNEILKSNKPHILIDVRPPEAFQIGSLPNAINIPKVELLSNIERIKELLNKKAEENNTNEVPC